MMLDLALLGIAVGAVCWAVNRHTKAKTLADMIALLRNDPGAIRDAVVAEVTQELDSLHTKIDGVLIPTIKSAAQWLRAEVDKIVNGTPVDVAAIQDSLAKIDAEEAVLKERRQQLKNDLQGGQRKPSIQSTHRSK